MTMEEAKQQAEEQWTFTSMFAHAGCGGYPTTIAGDHVTCTGCQYRVPFDTVAGIEVFLVGNADWEGR